MSLVIGPTYALGAGPGGAFAHSLGVVGSVLDSPVFVTTLATAVLGDPVVFEAGGGTHTLPVPIPRLAGLDEIEVARASFSIASAPFERSQSVSAASPANSAVGLTLAGTASGQAVSLTGLAIRGLKVTAEAGIGYALAGTNRTVFWSLDGDETVSGTENPGGTVQHLHLLVRPGGTGPGPPVAAAPHFEMPGAGRGMYGPALGGAAMQLTRRGDGLVDLTLTMAPAQPMPGCTVLIGTAAEGSAAIGAHKGLPNEVRGVTWSAADVEGRFDVRPKGITVTTHAGATDPADAALVAEFDTDPGSALRSVDFAPAARAVLADGYPTSSGTDLGLALRVGVATAGALHLQLGGVAARYVQRPEPDPAEIALRGAPEAVRIAVPPGLRPTGMSFRVDGRYGPARLTLDADETPAAPREGYRIAGPARLARRLPLDAKERTLPLARIAVFGRASNRAELLVTRHGGDELRIGPALGAPVSIPVAPSSAPRWHRAGIGPADGLPPHAPAAWVVVRASRGVFWWHADLGAGAGAAQASTDEGATWSGAAGRPLLQSWVLETDAGTGAPAPLQPVRLGWEGGLLNGDIVGLGESAQAPDFTRLWIAEGDAHAALLDGLALLDRPLVLELFCRRDVDLTLGELALTYDPWTAGGGA